MISQFPKVSYCIFCYKQRDFVADSLRSAFEQDYPNLEIIFSDDFSPDGSYEIALRIASEYQGPHEVTVRRNERNLGIVGHINEVGKTASGEYLVFTAGDDVSSPYRTRVTIEAVLSAPTRAAACYCKEIQFTADIPWKGLTSPVEADQVLSRIFLPEAVFSRMGGLADGALWTYSRECFHAFPGIPSTFKAEDHILPLRAALCGCVVEVDAPLVGRRLTEENLGRVLNTAKQSAPDEITRDLENHLICVMSDIASAVSHGAVSKRLAHKLIKRISHRVRRDSFRYPLMIKAKCELPAAAHFRNMAALLVRGEFRFAARYGKRWRNI